MKTERKTKKITFRLPPTLDDWLRHQAIRQGVTVGQLLRKIVRQAFYNRNRRD